MGLEILTLHSKTTGIKPDAASAPISPDLQIDKRKNAWRLALLLLIFLIYMCAGSLIFKAIEAPGEDATGIELKRFLQGFAAEHRCFKVSQLQDLIDRVVLASDKGIKISRNLTSVTNNWAFGQSFFFAGTLLTTVGYGHVSPVTQSGKAFTILYCLLGIPAFLILLHVVVERLKYPSNLLLDSLQDRLSGLYRPTQIQFMHLFSIFSLLVVFMFILPAGLFMFIEDDWTFLDAFYYCFISLTTIGLGDYIPGDKVEQPNRALYKIFTTGYLIVGIVCMMVFLAVAYDMPQLNFTRIFFKNEKDSERSHLARKRSPSTSTYTRQIDEEPATPAADTTGTTPIDGSYHY